MWKDIIDTLTRASFLGMIVGTGYGYAHADPVLLTFFLRAWATLTLLSVIAVPAMRAHASSFSATQKISPRSRELLQAE